MNAPRRPPRRLVDGVLLLDKPWGMTSNAALQAARRLYNAAKAGHTGTLDPLATGLLPLCFGEATKFAGELLDADKSYRATLKLGVTTDSGDAEGQVMETRPVNVEEARLHAVLESFLGDIEQVPPMHSALKRDGKPLYVYARQGIEVERTARHVRIHGLQLCSFEDDQAIIDVDCSKGTYVRTLAADIGAALGCGAHLAALRRTRIGGLGLSNVTTLDQLAELSHEERDARLAPADALLARVPQITLGKEDAARLMQGQAVPANGPAGQRFRAYGDDGRFLGLTEMSALGRLAPRRLIAAKA